MTFALLSALLPAALAVTMTTPPDDAAPAPPPGPLPLRVLYLGTAETSRAKDYEAFLRRHFADVRVADRRTFDPTSAGDRDVALLDWSQSDVDLGDLGALASPLGPRDAWAVPTVLLGSAGLLIATPWRTTGAYG